MKNIRKKPTRPTILIALTIAAIPIYAFAVTYQTTCPTEGDLVLWTGSQQDAIKVGQEHAFKYGHQTITKPIN